MLTIDQNSEGAFEVLDDGFIEAVFATEAEARTFVATLKPNVAGGARILDFSATYDRRLPRSPGKGEVIEIAQARIQINWEAVTELARSLISIDLPLAEFAVNVEVDKVLKDIRREQRLSRAAARGIRIAVHSRVRAEIARCRVNGFRTGAPEPRHAG